MDSSSSPLHSVSSAVSNSNTLFFVFDLSEDVLLKVLSKLPVKTLLRFRCVCKRWYDLISDSYFLRLHRSSQQSKSKQHLLFLFSTPETSMEEVPRIRLSFLKSIEIEKNNPITSEIFGSKFKCTKFSLLPTRFDLVCFVEKSYQEEILHISICNPSTQEIMTLPESQRPKSSFLVNNHVGFGFFESTGEYKVVCLISPGSDDDASLTKQCEVFTIPTERKRNRFDPLPASSSWSWRSVADFPYNVYIFTPPAFVNGAIHWLAINFPNYLIEPSIIIMAFDVESEKFRLLPYPKGSPRKSNPRDGLVELRGLLCLSSYVGNEIMEIWMFKDYHYESDNDHISGTWVKEYNIDLHFLCCQTGRSCFYEFYFPRDIEEEEEDTKVLIEKHKSCLGYYYIRSKSFKVIMKQNDRMPWLNFSFYVESLRSLTTSRSMQ